MLGRMLEGHVPPMGWFADGVNDKTTSPAAVAQPPPVLSDGVAGRMARNAATDGRTYMRVRQGHRVI